MTVQQLLDNVYLIYRGKIASKTPVFGSDKADIVLAIANMKQADWAGDADNVWASLFDIKTVGTTINTSTYSYNLDATFMFPSDFFTITKTTGDTVELSITKPQHRLDNPTSVYISGKNPKKVNFPTTAMDSSFNGGVLKAPAYYAPATMTLATDVVSVDDPNWLVYVVAAELCRNDPAKESQFANLFGIANDLYVGMVSANNNIGFKQGGTTPYNMPSIGDQTDQNAAFE